MAIGERPGADGAAARRASARYPQAPASSSSASASASSSTRCWPSTARPTTSAALASPIGLPSSAPQPPRLLGEVPGRRPADRGLQQQRLGHGRAVAVGVGQLEPGRRPRRAQCHGRRVAAPPSPR